MGAIIHWLNQVSGNFNTASDWSTGTVPGSQDFAYLDAPGLTNYTVSASTNETVGDLRLADTATLAIAGGAFTVFPSAIVNAGTITIGDGAALSAGVFIDNSGVIALESTGDPTTLALANPMFEDGGTILLGDNAGNIIDISSGGRKATLTNVDNTIVGSGTIMGPGRHSQITNEAHGVIDADNKTPLIIDPLIENTGLIETTGQGHLILNSVGNTGTFEADGGVITINNLGGTAIIEAGKIYVRKTFVGNLSFTGTTGVLKLAYSQGYTGKISGFSKAGGTSLDLADIGFVSSTEATYSGTTVSGVLTVTDGTHTARINLVGNYLSSTFVASSDGKGGTTVVDPTGGQAASAHRFIAAAAGLGARGAGTAGLAHDASQPRSAMLARPV